MTAKELFALVACNYKDLSDEERLSLGHHERPHPGDPISLNNLPEFMPYVSFAMSEVRQWATGEIDRLRRATDAAKEPEWCSTCGEGFMCSCRPDQFGGIT